MFSPLSRCKPSLQALNDNRARATAAIADTSASNLALLFSQHTEQSSNNPGTACAERVSEGDSTTVKVDLVLAKVQDLHVCKSYNTEGLVDLEGVDRALLNTGVLESFGDGQSRGSGELGRVLSSIAPTKDLSDRLQAQLLQFCF